MKRTWPFLLGLLLLAAPAAVQAQFDYTTNDGAITITGYTGPGGNVTIPTNINGLLVTGIGDYAFENITSLTSVALPGSVTDIGVGAFGNCYGLTDLTIAFGVTSIESNAFENCYSLTSVTIPDSVTNIGEEAFDYCLSLTSVTIPDSVTNIGEEAFEYCSSLISITIPDSVTNIGEGAFGYCSGLTNVTLPASVASIGLYMFYECADLTSVTIPGGVASIGDDAFEQCYSLTNVTILDSVTNIGAEAFLDCSSLGSVTIPGSVASIGDDAFSETQLTNVYFTGNSPAADSSVFDTNNHPTVYYLPGTTGWAEFSVNTGFSTALWNPVIQTRDGGFGVQNNQFGFDITGPTNLVVVVEACANLGAPVWTPLKTVTLTNGLFRFSEPVRANISSRFYGLGFP